MSSQVIVGDCLSVMPTLEANSIDAIVTDPPYHLTTGKKGGSGTASVNLNTPQGRARIGAGFMGKAWDGGDVAFRPETWEAALRIAKPGAFLVAFGGTRTFHRLTCAIEDAGWEIRDCLSWLYGSGFPKSLDVSKAIDKAAGAEREVIGMSARHGVGIVGAGSSYEVNPAIPVLTAPATNAAKQWDGWGTALKPAWEPIILARKPLIGTVAANVQEHGTGGLNIDGCRIDANGETWAGNQKNAHAAYSGKVLGRFAEQYAKPSHAGGRWPANVVLDEESARLLDEATGDLPAGIAMRSRCGGNTFGGSNPKPPMADLGYDDAGGASRFFYTAKASRSEREAGLDGFAAIRRSDGRESDVENPRLRTSSVANHHPTVKPIDLMQWLVRLVTPKGGMVLDPFCGSGSTGIAALREGARFIGIEQDAEYAEIARARIKGDSPLFTQEGAA